MTSAEISSCTYLEKVSEVSFGYANDFRPLSADHFMLEVSTEILDKLLSHQSAPACSSTSQRNISKKETTPCNSASSLGDVDMADADAGAEGSRGRSSAAAPEDEEAALLLNGAPDCIPKLRQEVVLVGMRDDAATLVTAEKQFSLYQLKNSNSQLLIKVGESRPTQSAASSGADNRESSSIATGPAPKRLKASAPDPGSLALEEQGTGAPDGNLPGPPSGTRGGATLSSSSAVGVPPIASSTSSVVDVEQRKKRLEIFTGFEDIVLLRPKTPDRSEVWRLLEKEYPCFWMPGYESNLKKYCTGEELRYRLSMNDETLQEVLRASTQIVRTAGKGYQFLDTAAHDKLLETLLWMQSSEEYMDQEKKTFHLDKCVYGFQYEFELEFLVTEPMVATMLRAVCVQEDEMTGDCKSFLRDTAKVLRILARQIFDTAQATSVPLVDFLTKWTEQLPVDFLEMQLTRDHIKPPFFVIRDKVIRAELELLPDESRARLERLFALSPIWYQKDLEFLLQPVLPTGVKSAAWLLKHARSAYIRNPSTGGEEVMFVSKFGTLPDTVKS